MESPNVPPPEALRFRLHTRTRWSDEDSMQVLNNAVYLSLLEEARWGYFHQLGLVDDEHWDFPFVLAQTNIRFLHPGRGERDVVVALATTRLGRSSFVQAYRITEAARGVVWAEAEALLVCWDPERRGKRQMDPAFRRTVAAFEGLERVHEP